MATSAPVVEKVTRTRTIPPAEIERERKTPEFWEYIESLTQDQWNDHILYILREDPKPSAYGGTNTLEKCTGYIAMPDGTKQLLNSREDIELAIRQKYGGKAYRLILKRGSERICEGKCVNDFAPKYPVENAAPLPVTATAQSSDTVAVKAMETVANQNPQLINIAIDAVSRAAELVARHNPPAATPAPVQPDEFEKALRQAMITRLLAPPPDPIDMYLKMKQVLEPPQNDLTNKLVTTALDRFMNPPAAASSRTTLLDLGREFIPVLGSTVKETMHEYRLAREADLRLAEISRIGAQPMPPAQPQQPAPQTNPRPELVRGNPQQPAAAAAPPEQEPQQPAGTPSFQWICERVANIVKNVEYPVDEAVDRLIAFLYDVDEKLVPMLLDPPKLDPRLSPGKQGLVQLFQYEPILSKCMVNTPRTLEFIDKFIVAATEAEKESEAPPAQPPQNPPSA